MTDFRIENLAFQSDHVDAWDQLDPLHVNWPVVYLLANKQDIYVGETGNAGSRLRQHLAAPERRHLKGARVILNHTFNKSVCQDLESQLIQLFHADGKFRVLNGNAGISNSDYFQRAKYRQDFDALFEELRVLKFLTRSVPEIVNSNLFKYSPFKALTTDQSIATTKILETLLSSLDKRSGSETVIQGDPGTGKTIVAIYLVKLLLDIATRRPSDESVDQDSMFAEFFIDRNTKRLANLKIGLVIPQQSLRKTIRKVFKQIPNLDHTIVMDQFDVGKSKHHWDLLIVDEAHRLGIRANQAAAAQNRRFVEINKRLFGKDDLSLTQLDWIRNRSKHRILLVDAAQSIRPADLSRNIVDDLVKNAEEKGRLLRLTSQMRVAGGGDYIRFATKLLSDSPEHGGDFGKYDLRFFDDFSDFIQQVRLRDSESGLSRMVAGFAWKWVSRRNAKKHDIEIDGHKLFWNRTPTDWVNSSSVDDEVGSIHTIQGYDLNYAGVIIGRDLGFDANSQKVFFRRDNYFDLRGRQNNRMLNIVYSDEDLKQYVLNIYRVLLTRGMKGTYVYVVDEDLRNHVRQFFPNT